MGNAQMYRQSPEFTDEEIHRLLREIEGQSKVPPPDVRIKRPRSNSAAIVERELSVDELLEKIQRDINDR